jgi:hypothetical protein
MPHWDSEQAPDLPAAQHEEKGVTWDFEGTQLLPRQVAQFNYDAGFINYRNLELSVVTVTLESRRWSRAWHKNFDADGNLLSTDYTYWQINDKAHPDVVTLWNAPDTEDTWREVAHLAHDIFKNNGYTFAPWAAFPLIDQYPKEHIEAINGVCNMTKEYYGFPLVH